MYELTLDYPNEPKGKELTIQGLGTFENGKTYTVSKEDADAFRVQQVSLGMPDVTLLQAFSKQPYVTVTTTSSNDSDAKPSGDGTDTVKNPTSTTPPKGDDK